jgi:SAM-dependent methyltransferase
VDGLDYSRTLLSVAKRRGSGRRLRYTRGDMRHLPARWTARFDAVLNLFTSFGFFVDPADDRRVLAEMARVLAPNGILLWHGGSRDGVMARFLERDWWKTSNGTVVAHERAFDPLSGVLTVHATWSGPEDSGERHYRVRLYTATRIAELCAEVGLIVENAFDGFVERPLRRRSSEMLLVARKSPLPGLETGG